MFEQYFDDWEVKPHFRKEYVSLWSGWLGKKNMHRLDQVSEQEWSRFHTFISSISRKFKVGVVNCNTSSVSFPADLSSSFVNFSVSLNRDASLFQKYMIPELECVITEEWDYTYIIWHKRNGAIGRLSPYILESKLKHFAD